MTMLRLPGTISPVPFLAGGYHLIDQWNQPLITTFEALNLDTGIWSIVPAEVGNFKVPPGDYRPLVDFRAREGATMYMNFDGDSRPVLYDNGKWYELPVMESYNGGVIHGLSIDRNVVCG